MLTAAEGTGTGPDQVAARLSLMPGPFHRHGQRHRHRRCRARRRHRSKSMNWNTETETAIIATLRKMGPLTFVPLVKLTHEPRQRIGHAIIRLRASGKVAIHEHRLLEAARPLPEYCAARNPPSTALVAAGSSGGPPVDAAGRKTPEAPCPACGWQWSSMDEPEKTATAADAVAPALSEPPTRSDPMKSPLSGEDRCEERRCRACGDPLDDTPNELCISCESETAGETED